MELLQQLLVYLALGVAIVYLAWKFFLPGKLKKAGKASAGPCEQDNCACH